MSVATIHTAHIVGLHAEHVAVELDVGNGLYSFSIVGLPDKAIDESKDRVITALKNSNLRNPKTENHKVTVSLSPANIKKEGSHFDLPIALAYLTASKQVTIPKDAGWFIGELSLKGDILPAKGVLAIAEKAKALGIRSLYVPKANEKEALLIDGLTVYGCETLREVVEHFSPINSEGAPHEMTPAKKAEDELVKEDAMTDFNEIKSQETAKRALEIAAAGGHNITLYGPPGTGKTMLARAFTGILPNLTQDERIEVTKIHSITESATSLITRPPLRHPHHTASYVSVVGGGTNPRPGEVTLAHRGVLFLDEFPEFDKKVIESLREPLEEGVITVSRAKGTYTFPASCSVITSMNPCPCGYYGSNVRRCVCSPSDIDRYAKKLSGPIMDRIDMWVPVAHVDYDTLSQKSGGEGSKEVRARVKSARDFAEQRFKKSGITTITRNKDMKPKDLEHALYLEQKAEETMKLLAGKASLSPRSYHRVLRLARTIADLRKSDTIGEGDILEAFQYRPKLYKDRV
jgi:magnesium chelatase family protein